MKSKVSFFDKAVFRKDITRFAPLWAIYLIGGLLTLLTALAATSYPHDDIAATIGPLSTVNMIYAGLCAQLLFGDLYSSRMCNALHAMPLRRETWFITHVVSGLCFSIVPHAIGTVLMFPSLQTTCVTALLWLAGMILEYLFFFGLAVFCVFLTGNRLGMAAVYAILNLGAMIAYWFVDTIYGPLLYGVHVPVEPFHRFSPVVQMSMETELVFFQWQGQSRVCQGLSDGWWYLILCAALGIGLLAAALLLYRRRKLECAGDFIAVKPVEPVFAVVFTLCVGGVCAAFEQAFGNAYISFLCVGLVVGWFVGQMLLQRTIRVFKGKAFLKLSILALGLGTTILLTWIDPVGITRWVPQVEQVKMVRIETGSKITWDYMQFQEKESIRKVIEAHSGAIETRYDHWNGRTITIQYTMTDDRQVERTYCIRRDTKEWNTFAALYNTPEQILGYTEWEAFVENTQVYLEKGDLYKQCLYYVISSGKYPEGNAQEQAVELNRALTKSLLEAMKKDCEEGLLPQEMQSDKVNHKCWIELVDLSNYHTKTRSVSVYDISKNTLAWMKEYSEIINYMPTD